MVATIMIQCVYVVQWVVQRVAITNKIFHRNVRLVYPATEYQQFDHNHT